MARSTFPLGNPWCRVSYKGCFIFISVVARHLGFLKCEWDLESLWVSKSPQTLIPPTSSGLFCNFNLTWKTISPCELWVLRTFHTNLQAVSYGFVSPWLWDLSEKNISQTAPWNTPSVSWAWTGFLGCPVLPPLLPLTPYVVSFKTMVKDVKEDTHSKM